MILFWFYQQIHQYEVIMTSNCVIVSIKLYQYAGYDEYRAVTLFYAILVGRSRSPLPYTVVESKKKKPAE